MPRDSREFWNDRYRTRGPIPGGPSRFLASHADLLPDPGRALDVGGGSGRNAVWLAECGWDVTVVDVSEEGLALAQAAADSAGVTVRTLLHDLEEHGLPPGTWDLIVCTLFLHRPLFEAWPAALTPGGVLLFEQPTRRNLERRQGPSRGFCLEDGELPGLVTGLEVLEYEEGWNETGRHEARLVARKPG